MMPEEPSGGSAGEPSASQSNTRSPGGRPRPPRRGPRRPRFRGRRGPPRGENPVGERPRTPAEQPEPAAMRESFDESAETADAEPMEAASEAGMSQGDVREEVETAEVVPPPSPARPPQPPHQQRGAPQPRHSRSDQQRYRQPGSPVHKAIQDVEHII